LINNAHINPKKQPQDHNRWRYNNPPPTAGRHVKHVLEEGSRYHVIHYNTTGRHCSTVNCEINYSKRKD